MKRKTKFLLLPLLGASLLFSSCGVRLRPLEQGLVKVTPTPLELVGSSVPAEIHITFPKNYFAKKGQLRITPILRFGTQEVRGTAYDFQGEEVLGNDPTISYQEGRNVTLRFSVPYQAKMRRSTLVLALEDRSKGGRRMLPELKVAEGVIATAGLASVRTAMPALAPHGFERIVREAYDTDILFNIQQANVRSSELKKEEVEEWRNLVQNAKETPNQEVSVEIQSYASPDGKQQLNERLSESREKNTMQVLKQEFAKQRLSDVAIDAHYTAEDWEGFRRLVEQSNLPDKALVLRVLEMYPDPEQREREIRNISVVFGQLASEILPRLRRSRLIANVKIVGKSDEEILQWAAKFPGHLSLEELLYAATLQTNSADQLATYELAKKIFPTDYRPYNNLGVLAWLAGDRTKAEVLFSMAQKKQSNPYASANLGLVALSDGDEAKANELIAYAADAPEASEVMGMLYLYKGEYAKAQQAFGEAKSNHAAVAQLFNLDYKRAMETLSAIAKPDGATAYLKAVVAARMGEPTQAVSFLSEAIQLDGNLLERAKEDLEFRAMSADPAFLQLFR